MLNDLVAGSDLDPMYAQSIVTVEDPGTMKMWTRATSDPVTGCNPN
jgi:hypothetical protein